MINNLSEKFSVDNTTVLEKILKKFKPTCAKIESLSKSLVKLNVEHKETAKGVLTQLTGYYMELITVLRKLEALKKNKELAYYFKRKIEIEGEGTKFSSAPTEREASLFVADERKVRNLIQGYVDSCLEGIRTCRTIVHDNKNIPTGTE